MNTKNRKEKIQGRILAKSFIDDFVYKTENTENEESTSREHRLRRALPTGYIYGFNLLNIAFKDLNII